MLEFVRRKYLGWVKPELPEPQQSAENRARAQRAKIILEEPLFVEAYQDELDQVTDALLRIDPAKPEDMEKARGLIYRGRAMQDLIFRLNGYINQAEIDAARGKQSLRVA
jgi:regulator of sirC expression with transglutaminase-like and TPR domain